MLDRVYNVKYASRFEFSEDHETVSSRVTIKTVNETWVTARTPSIILVSIDSLFHRGATGGVKMKGLVELIREHSTGPVEIFLADNAHSHTLSLCSEEPVQTRLSSLDALRRRFVSLFRGFRVIDSSDVKNEASYIRCCNQIASRYQSDKVFQDLVIQDAELSYDALNDEEICERSVYVEAAICDVLEQCVTYCVFMEKGYGHLFYPGKHNASHLHHFHNLNFNLVNVFLALHSKKVVRGHDVTSAPA